MISQNADNCDESFFFRVYIKAMLSDPNIIKDGPTEMFNLGGVATGPTGATGHVKPIPEPSPPSPDPVPGPGGGTSYPIKQWSGLIHGNNQYPLPIVYIKPDANFQTYAKDNNYKIKVKVMNTGSKCYDGRVLTGTVNSSAELPNCRPNFFEDTGLYTITLQSSWLGYPEHMGVLYIEDIPVIGGESFKNNTYNNTQVLRNVRNSSKPTGKSGLSSEQLFWILISVFLGVPLLILIIMFLIKMFQRG